MHRGEHANGPFGKYALTGERATVEQHLAEARVVVGRRVESAVALRRAVARAEVPAGGCRRQGARVFVFYVAGGHPGPLRGAWIKRRVLHAERIEHTFLKKRIKRHPAHDLDDAAGKVDAGLGVFPFLAGLVLHFCREPHRHEIGERFGGLGRRAAGFAETRSMGENLGNGEVGWLARGRLEVGELGDVVRDEVGNVELALVLQDHDRGTGDRLRHRRDPHERVGRHRAPGGDVGVAVAF